MLFKEIIAVYYGDRTKPLIALCGEHVKILIVKVSWVAQYSVWLRAGRPGDRGSISNRGQMIFFSSPCVQTGSGAHPASCTMGTGGPFSGVKRGWL
jgi:hypothetical protein